MSEFQLHCGDALSVLKTLPSESVDTCVTSPPYFGLRDYGTGQWEGGDGKCEHSVQRWEGAKQTQGAQSGHSSKHDVLSRKECHCGALRVDRQLGLEATPDEYVARLVEVFGEVRRVLKPQACVWLNLGDTYAAGKTGRTDHGSSDITSRLGPKRDGIPGGSIPGPVAQRKVPEGLKPKDLIGIPWMTAFALRSDGWWLRSEVIWAKPNPMPESVTDRPTKSHEQVFLLAKSERYYYDIDAIREPFQTDGCENYPARAHITGRGDQGAAVARGNDRGKSGGFPPASHKGSSFNRGKTGVNGMGRVSDAEREDNPLGRNKRSVWTIPLTASPVGETSRRVRVEVDAPCDGSQRITSPDCPMHGDLYRTVPSGSCDGRGADWENHSGHNGSGLDPMQGDDSVPTGQLPDVGYVPGRPDLPQQLYSGAAIHRSNQRNRTDPAVETDRPCTPSAERSHDTGRIQDEPEFAEPVQNKASNRSEVDFDEDAKEPSIAQTLPSNSGRCTCSNYIVKTEKTSHFAVMPEALVEPCILAGCPESGTVIDPFCGSGTVGAVALLHKRNFIGIDLNPDYIQMARRRLYQASSPLLGDVEVSVAG